MGKKNKQPAADAQAAPAEQHLKPAKAPAAAAPEAPKEVAKGDKKRAKSEIDDIFAVGKKAKQDAGSSKQQEQEEEPVAPELQELAKKVKEARQKQVRAGTGMKTNTARGEGGRGNACMLHSVALFGCNRSSQEPASAEFEAAQAGAAAAGVAAACQRVRYPTTTGTPATQLPSSVVAPHCHPCFPFPSVLTSATPLLLCCFFFSFFCCCGCCTSGGCPRWAAPQGGGVQGRHLWCRGAQGAAAHHGGLCHLQRAGAAAGGTGRRHRPVPL